MQVNPANHLLINAPGLTRRTCSWPHPLGVQTVLPSMASEATRFKSVWLISVVSLPAKYVRPCRYAQYDVSYVELILYRSIPAPQPIFRSTKDARSVETRTQLYHDCRQSHPFDSERQHGASPHTDRMNLDECDQP